jgi:hypothetical protein
VTSIAPSCFNVQKQKQVVHFDLTARAHKCTIRPIIHWQQLVSIVQWGIGCHAHTDQSVAGASRRSSSYWCIALVPSCVNCISLIFVDLARLACTATPSCELHCSIMVLHVDSDLGRITELPCHLRTILSCWSSHSTEFHLQATAGQLNFKEKNHGPVKSA